MVDFRISSKTLFLTYPRCPINICYAHDFFVNILGPVTYMIIAREEHKDKELHLHALIVNAKKLDIRGHTRLDLIDEDGTRYHGNYASARNKVWARKYCMKEGDFVEYGVWEDKKPKRKDQIAAHNDKLLRLTEKESVDKGYVELMHLDKLVLNKRIYENLEYAKPISVNRTSRNLWIWGAPGIGKTRYVHQECPLHYKKMMNKWWDGYANQNVVLLDDLDHTHAKELGYLIKIWSDNYSFIGEVKGASLHLKYEQIIITSNYLPEELWVGDTSMQQAIRRRFQFYTVEEVLDLGEDDQVGISYRLVRI